MSLICISIVLQQIQSIDCDLYPRWADTCGETITFSATTAAAAVVLIAFGRALQMPTLRQRALHSTSRQPHTLLRSSSSYRSLGVSSAVPMVAESKPHVQRSRFHIPDVNSLALHCRRLRKWRPRQWSLTWLAAVSDFSQLPNVLPHRHSLKLGDRGVRLTAAFLRLS